MYTRSNFLNGGYNSQVGLSKSIKVYPGDVIHAEVYAKYWNQSTNNSNLAAFAAALTAAFGVKVGRDLQSRSVRRENFDRRRTYGPNGSLMIQRSAMVRMISTHRGS